MFVAIVLGYRNEVGAVLSEVKVDHEIKLFQERGLANLRKEILNVSRHIGYFQPHDICFGCELFDVGDDEWHAEQCKRFERSQLKEGEDSRCSFLEKLFMRYLAVVT